MVQPLQNGLPAALLHLDGGDRLRPEALVGLAASARPAGEVALGAPPAPLSTRRRGQIQRRHGSPAVNAAETHKRGRFSGEGQHLLPHHVTDSHPCRKTLRSVRLGSTVRLLQEGAPQLAHRHPSVELRGAVPTQRGGRVLLVTLTGGGWRRVVRTNIRF